jgi:hypothetical protein
MLKVKMLGTSNFNHAAKTFQLRQLLESFENLHTNLIFIICIQTENKIRIQ